MSPHTDKPTLLEEIFEARDMIAAKHYAAVGMVASNWAYFEAVIDDWSMRLANIHPHVGACLTAQIAGSGRKLDAFISIVRLLNVSEPSAKTLEEFARKASGLAEQRNRAAHDFWDLTNPEDPKRFEITARKKLRLEMVPVSTDELLKLASNISALQNDFEELAVQALTGQRKPLPER